MATGGAACCPWPRDRPAHRAPDPAANRRGRSRTHRRAPARPRRLLGALDFPFDGDVIGLTAFLQATAANGDQRPFGHYLITRAADGLAIGGIGFKGQPDNGSVEIGYGLAPSARGDGYAAEAARALVVLARQQGLARIVADTDEDNIASQRTLERAGFTQTGTNGDLCLYAIVLVA